MDLTLYVYEEENTGGELRLSKEDYIILRENGWKISWAKHKIFGRIASDARKKFASPEDAVAEWKKLLPHHNWDELPQCNRCCGKPHKLYDDDFNRVG